MPTESSPKVFLSKLSQSNLDQVLIWKNDIDLARLIVASEQPATLENVNEWYTKTIADSNQVLFGIFMVSDSSLIGIARLMFIDYQHRTAEIGLYLGDARVRGMGLGKAAVKELIHYAFLTLGLERLYLRVLSSNTAAINCYISCGFRHEGIWRQHVLINGKREDMILMGLLRYESELS